MYVCMNTFEWILLRNSEHSQPLTLVTDVTNNRFALLCYQKGLHAKQSKIPSPPQPYRIVRRD